MEEEWKEIYPSSLEKPLDVRKILTKEVKVPYSYRGSGESLSSRS